MEEKNMILHIFMYNVISDFSVVTPAREGRVNAIYKYLRVLSSKQVNPSIIPPDALRRVLVQIKDDIKSNPRLQLPEDPNVNIWNY